MAYEFTNKYTYLLVVGLGDEVIGGKDAPKIFSGVP